MAKPGRPRVVAFLPAELVARYAAGELTIRGVARVAGISETTAAKRLREAGIDTSREARAPIKRRGGWRKRIDLTPEDLARYAKGELDHRDLARMKGVSGPLILRELKRRGTDTSVGTRKRFMRSRRPEVNRRELVAVWLYAKGLTLEQVARRLGVVQSSVRNYLIRRGVRPRRPEDYPLPARSTGK
jgi:hypothetical protein